MAVSPAETARKSRITRLLAVTGILTTVLSCASCADTDSTGHPHSATPAAVPSWRVVPSVRVDCRRWRARTPSVTTLLSVAASGPDDAWATGSCEPKGGLSSEEGGDPVGVIEHWDGEKWRQVPAPSDTSYETVAALSKKDAWAAGEHGLIHWDGRRWTKVSRGLPGDVVSMPGLLSATSAQNVWAMVRTGLGEQEVLVRWDGGRWRVVPPPHGCQLPGDGDTGDLAAGPAQDVWTDGVICSKTDENTVWHYDGHRWTGLRPPPLAHGWNVDGITVIGQDTSVTVDDDDPSTAGDGHTKTYRWTAGAWRQLPDPGGYAQRGMVGDGHGGIWVLGPRVDAYGDPATTRIRHWDGHRWSEQALPTPPSGPTSDLRALAHVPGTSAVWGVGTDAGDHPLIEAAGPL